MHTQPSSTCSNTDDDCSIEGQTPSAATPGTSSATLEACPGIWGHAPGPHSYMMISQLWESRLPPFLGHQHMHVWVQCIELRHAYADAQRQVGGSDCPLFAIAFATTLCMGGYPHTPNYVQAAMRIHLCRCFELQVMSPFPAANLPRRLGRQRIIRKQNVVVYCVCRLPWDKHDHQRGPLVRGCTCWEWYHKTCLAIDQNTIDNPTAKYTCKRCLKVWLGVYF